MLVVVHALEAYVLNPKFMASRTEITYVLYPLSSYLVANIFGVWGLDRGDPDLYLCQMPFRVKPVHSKGERSGRKLEKLSAKMNAMKFWQNMLLPAKIPIRSSDNLKKTTQKDPQATLAVDTESKATKASASEAMTKRTAHGSFDIPNHRRIRKPFKWQRTGTTGRE